MNNLSIIEGILIKDAETYYTKKGNSICQFFIGINNDIISIYTNDGIADYCHEFLKKGVKIRSTGKLKKGTWKNKEGNTKYKIYMEAASIELLNI